MLFLSILINSILPIFIMIGAGFIMDRAFSLDLRTLGKLNFYLLLPAFIFRALYTADFQSSTIEIVLCGLVILFLNSGLSSVICHYLDYDMGKTEAFRNSVMFNNGGNIGVAVATFIFTRPPYLVNGEIVYLHDAMVTIVALLIIQNISCNTLGFYQAGKGKITARDAISLVFHMPTIYVVPSALLLRLAPLDLTALPFWPSLSFIANAFVAMAMITLGAQVARTPFNFFRKDVMLATGTRLLLGPIVAYIAIIFFMRFYAPFESIAAQSIMIVYGVPSAVNTALMAVEMNNHPEYATQIVVATTALSALTMPLVIYAAYYLFPL